MAMPGWSISRVASAFASTLVFPTATIAGLSAPALTDVDAAPPPPPPPQPPPPPELLLELPLSTGTGVSSETYSLQPGTSNVRLPLV